MKNWNNCLLFDLVPLLLALCSNVHSQFDGPFKVSLTISAMKNALEVSWSDLKTPNDGYIILTDEKPQVPFNKHTANNGDVTWTYGKNNKSSLYFTKPTESSGWITTNVIFNHNLLKNINMKTKCYGYWAVHVDNMSNVTFKTCVRAYATWMNDHKEALKRFKFRDLFILGTHDSGCYKTSFKIDTLITKYTITQDDNIRYQLMHGVRYLDIRPAYYSTLSYILSYRFWINHDFVPINPLVQILHQVRNFVNKTNEIVILGFKEFPHGFDKKMDIHRKLVKLVKAELGDMLVDAKRDWNQTLGEIWKSGRNVIFSYDFIKLEYEYPSTVFQSVQQRWGDKKNLSDLKQYLISDKQPRYPRPFADMAELTPGTSEVILNTWGGLRKVADQSNRKLSKWYAGDWLMLANIVAVDFYRGTTLMESVIESNLKRANRH